MIRITGSRASSLRQHPLPSTYRQMPMHYTEEGLYVSQGRAKRVQLGETVRPFESLFVRPSALVTQIRYKKDAGAWSTVSAGDYPDLITSARNVTFSPEVFATEVVYTLEITATAIVVTREVNLLCDVVAGKTKVAERNFPVCPFFDALFSIDGALLSAVNYKVDAGAKTAIPVGFGTSLEDRVRAFSIIFTSAGEKRVILYVTDAALVPVEYSDSLIVRVA